MATRLPVVIAQSVRREPAAIHCEEQLITALLFTPGLDATLIGPLESIEPGSTDHLCLEGLKGRFGLLSWAPLMNSQQQLSRLGIHGTIIDRDSQSHEGRRIETTSGHDPNRRIDFYQLNADQVASIWIESLKTILETQEVKAFSIQIPGRTLSQVGAVISREVPIPIQKRPANETVANNAASNQPSVFAKSIDLDDEDEVWAHLDELVDDLDQADV